MFYFMKRFGVVLLVAVTGFFSESHAATGGTSVGDCNRLDFPDYLIFSRIRWDTGTITLDEEGAIACNVTCPWDRLPEFLEFLKKRGSDGKKHPTFRCFSIDGGESNKDPAGLTVLEDVLRLLPQLRELSITLTNLDSWEGQNLMGVFGSEQSSDSLDLSWLPEFESLTVYTEANPNIPTSIKVGQRQLWFHSGLGQHPPRYWVWKEQTSAALVI